MNGMVTKHKAKWLILLLKSIQKFTNDKIKIPDYINKSCTLEFKLREIISVHLFLLSFFFFTKFSESETFYLLNQNSYKINE